MPDDSQGFAPSANLAGPGGTPIGYADPQALQRAYIEMLLRGRQNQQQQPIRSWTQVAGGILDTAADKLQLSRLMTQSLGANRDAAAAAVSGLPGGDTGGPPAASGDGVGGGAPMSFSAPSPAPNQAAPGGSASTMSQYHDSLGLPKINLGPTSSQGPMPAENTNVPASATPPPGSFHAMPPNAPLDPLYARTVGMIESNNNPNAPRNAGGNRGLYQFGPEEERRYGLNEQNWNDASAQHSALDQETRYLSNVLAARGIDPTSANLYFTHQQGVGGGPALLSADPNSVAWKVLRPMYKSDAMAKSAITGNLYPGMSSYYKSVDDITAGGFRGDWQNTYRQFAQRAQRDMPPTPPQTVPPTPAAAGAPPQAPTGTPPPAPLGAPPAMPPGGLPQPPAGAGPAAPPGGVPPSATGGAAAPTTPMAPPTPGVPTFIPPTQQFPQGVRGQIQGMLSSPNPTVQAEGYRQLNAWQERLNTVQHIERGGMIYAGNDYRGYTTTGIPAKPEIQRADIEAGGVKVPRFLQPEYDASGRFTGYKPVQVAEESAPGQASPPSGPPAPGGAGSAPGAESAPPPMPGARMRTPTDVQGAVELGAAAEAAKTAANKQSEADVKYYDSLHRGLTGSAMIAAQQKQNIDILRQVANSPSFMPGAGSGLALGYQRLTAQLGVDPTAAAPREIFNQVAARVLADQFSGMRSMSSETGEAASRVFKPMLDIEEKANITANDSLAGINAKLDMLDKTGDLMMKWGDLADDYKVAHGHLDAGFDKQLRSEIGKSRVENVVPKAPEKPEGSKFGTPLSEVQPPAGAPPAALVAATSPAAPPAASPSAPTTPSFADRAGNMFPPGATPPAAPSSNDAGWHGLSPAGMGIPLPNFGSPSGAAGSTPMPPATRPPGVGSSIMDILRAAPGNAASVTQRTRGAMGLPPTPPPAPANPLSTSGARATAMAQAHPQGALFPLAAGLGGPAAAGIRGIVATPAGRAILKYLLEGAGVGGAIAGTEHLLGGGGGQ